MVWEGPGVQTLVVLGLASLSVSMALTLLLPHGAKLAKDGVLLTWWLAMRQDSLKPNSEMSC